MAQVNDTLEEDEAHASSEDSASVISLRPADLNYKYENGRRYHAFREGEYLLPNDKREQDRMELVHLISEVVLNDKLHYGPIASNPQCVLDLGTGTGTWAIEFAEKHPSAEVIGTDLSPIQPNWVPPNCIFEIWDFEREWTYRKKFDYIHARELGGCISDDSQLFRCAFQHLAPGGYLELQATHPQVCSDDGTDDRAESAHFWVTQLCDGFARFGKPLDLTLSWENKMKAAGFIDVESEIFSVPIGSWPDDPKLRVIGEVHKAEQEEAIHSYTPAIFSRVLGWDQTDVETLTARVKQDFNNADIHLYKRMHVIWGKKAMA